MCGFAFNFSFVHLLKQIGFDAVVDHLALTQVIKIRFDPANYIVKKL